MARTSTIPQLTKSEARRFWSKVRIKSEDECWEWTRARNKGYGKFSLRGSVYRSHRISYALAKGHIPRGYCIMHLCDNPPCCNPAHLRLGTVGDNNRDTSSKGRVGKVLGKRNASSVLNREQVREIRQLYATGDYSMREVGLQFGVSHQTVFEIVNRKRWTHVTG